MKSRNLLEFDFGAGGLELLLDLFGVGLGSAFLDGLRRALDEVLGLLEAEAGDGANFLDDADLVGASVSEDDVELGLLLSGSGSGGTGGRGGSDGDRSGGGNAPLGLEILNKGSDLDNGLAGELLDDLVFGDVGHGISETASARAIGAGHLRDESPSLPSVDCCG